MQSSIPSSSLLYWNDLAVAVETCVTGATLSSRVAGSSRDGDLRLVIDWLADFHDATAVERVPAGAWLTARLVNGLCRDFVATFGATDDERLLFARLARQLTTGSLGTMPVVWQHTDFGPWNVYRDGDRISVIDWEVARRGPGLADLLYFATHWSTAVASRTEADERFRHFESLFFDPNESALSAAIHQGLREYMQRAGITAPLLPHLLVYMVLEQALDRAGRFVTMEDAAASSREGNRYIGYLGVLARRAEQLFPAEVPCAA
jgi:aminoglycoside phosphotransferase (APT) family kinase protein